MSGITIDGCHLSAVELRDAVNRLHELGYDENGNGPDGKDEYFYFCQNPCRVGMMTEAEADKHFSEVHAEPNWRSLFVGPAETEGIE